MNGFISVDRCTLFANISATLASWMTTNRAHWVFRAGWNAGMWLPVSTLCFLILCFLLPCLLLPTLSGLLHSSHPFPLLLLYAVGALLCTFSSSWNFTVNAFITSKNICWKHTLVALMSDGPVSFETLSLCTSEAWCLLKNSWSILFCALHFRPPHRPG